MYFKRRLSFKELGQWVKDNKDNTRELFKHDPITIKDCYGDLKGRTFTPDVKLI